MSIRSFSSRITSRPSSSKIQNSTLQNLPRGFPSLHFQTFVLILYRSVPAIMGPVAVLCILPLALNVILQNRLLSWRRMYFFKVFLVLYLFGLCMCVFPHLAYVMYISILGLFLEFLYFLPFGMACLHDWHCMK
jgi:hypothetical protein